MSFRRFAQMVWNTGNATGTREKLALLSEYLKNAPDADKVWAIAIFTGRRPGRMVNSRLLREWCAERAGLPAWLFDECYHTVGDLAETIALLNSDGSETQEDEAGQMLLADLIGAMSETAIKDVEEKKAFVQYWWDRMDFETGFVFNKLITGGFRIGVSQQMMVNALQEATEKPASELAHCISGEWNPAAISFDALMNSASGAADASKPYPFYLSYPLGELPEQLGNPSDWQAEWKWDGIRGQLIKRNDTIYIWSRGGELITGKFPELQVPAVMLPNGVCLDGEIVCLAGIDPSWVSPRAAGTHPESGNDDNMKFIAPAAFSQLQTRITRKKVSKKQLTEAPVGFIAYDLLELEGKDIRQTNLEERRRMLEQLIVAQAYPFFQLSPLIRFHTWKELTAWREQSREYSSEGIMLKRKQSVYQAGRRSGDWWKWKTDPFTIDAVMIYAQKGHGRRSHLFTDFTFAVKDGDRLVSFTKAYSGLTDEEFARVDQFVKKNAIEKFGPVRTVKPELVFEIAFEGIAASNRHKSGVALRFPRISRWRTDKKPDEINTLEDLRNMLAQYGSNHKDA